MVLLPFPQNKKLYISEKGFANSDTSSSPSFFVELEMVVGSIR
jgi:hypothetical protein